MNPFVRVADPRAVKFRKLLEKYEYRWCGKGWDYPPYSSSMKSLVVQWFEEGMPDELNEFFLWNIDLFVGDNNELDIPY
nr:hypothetical protein 67 [bacterium]